MLGIGNSKLYDDAELAGIRRRGLLGMGTSMMRAAGQGKSTWEGIADGLDGMKSAGSSGRDRFSYKEEFLNVVEQSGHDPDRVHLMPWTLRKKLERDFLKTLSPAEANEAQKEGDLNGL